MLKIISLKSNYFNHHLDSKLGFWRIPLGTIKAVLFHNSHTGRIIGKTPGFWLCADTLTQSHSARRRMCPQAPTVSSESTPLVYVMKLIWNPKTWHGACWHLMRQRFCAIQPNCWFPFDFINWHCFRPGFSLDRSLFQWESPNLS